MTVQQLCKECGFTPIVLKNLENEVNSAYACDLISWVIGRAPENAALVTVMTNVNVIAVAAMTDLSCVVLTEGVKLDENALEKAHQNGIPVVSSSKPTYETCILISKVLD